MVRHHHRIASAIALTLALAAAAPAAAKFELNPPAGASTARTASSTSVCSGACSDSGYAAQNKGAALPHDPRPRAVALAGAGYGYGSTPTASIRSTGPAGPGVVLGARHDIPVPAATTVHVATPKDGFDWGDAGIGAGGAVGLMLLLGGAAVGVTSIRRRASRSTA